MTARLADEERGRRIAELRFKRGMTQEMLADLVRVDVGTVRRWERGAQIRQRNFVALASALEVGLDQLEAVGEAAESGSPGDVSQRDLRVVEFVVWLAEASGKTFDETYQAVAKRADRREAETGSKRHSRNYSRVAVTREDLAEAVAEYYHLPEQDRRLYTASVGGTELTLSILTDPSWSGIDIDLHGDIEQASIVSSPAPVTGSFTEALFNAGVARLADAEVNDKVLMNNPMYRLLSIEVGKETLHPKFGLAEFADYALRNGMMEVEMVDVIAGSDEEKQTPLRDSLLPSVTAALNFDSYFCTGGPVCLVAIARPAVEQQPADYALLIQVRGKQVMDIAGKLSTVPKGWHQPLGEPTSQARFSTTLLRELEEELLGREDLEQLSDESRRTADPLHRERHPEAMLPLLDNHEKFHVRCTGFGLNLLSGTYEVPCLIVIDDEEWWGQWGHLIAGNWETTSVDCYSSMDTDGLAALAHDPRWSNEGLFAFLEGLRVLTEIDQTRRVAAPQINVRR